MKLDSTGTFQEINYKVIEASYVIALEIAKQKKPHTIGETYFLKLSDEELDLIQNPFNLVVEKIPDDCQDEFLEFQNDWSNGHV